MNPLFLIILSLIGIGISSYLLYAKKNNKKLVCLSKHDCDAVVKSKYGKTLGVENTIFGILFYVLILIYGVLLFSNRNIFKGDIVYYFLVGASIISVLFSLYLTGVQAFVLKKWCDYCIVSSITSLLILLALII